MRGTNPTDHELNSIIITIYFSSNHTVSLPQSSSTYPTASNESDPYKEDLGISHIAKMILMNDRIISDVSLPIHFQCIAEA
jgi:hypothetical protein